MLDQLVGAGMLAVATIVFVYYSSWTFILPFVDESHFLHQFFPPRVWAIRIPVILLVIAFGIVGTFVSSVMIKQAEKEKKKLAAKKST
ncbi:Dolichol phosphate-mannose biosynthesis regulatory protein [Yarrowia sp. C11]|nr:Dolichol phosphate-mannose biosynthesis regulatory protein [Yarrowia sp. E02]KAG5373106.1 Dolichol phosphate-mannose biosynthesis regulatory protein [Yarrowia sp. C11]